MDSTLFRINGEWDPITHLEDDSGVVCGEPKRQNFPRIAPADPRIEVLRPRLTWADPKPADRFPGFVVTRGAVSQPQPPSPFASPDAPQAFEPGRFGSAHLIRKG